MWQNFADLDRTFAVLDALQRQAFARPPAPSTTTSEPLRFTADDTGESWVVSAELPGVPREAIEVTLTGQVLRIAATRKRSAVADGDDVIAHRVERPAFSFNKSITLPHKVDIEHVTATAKDGVFTVTLPKAREAQPRQIAVR